MTIKSYLMIGAIAIMMIGVSNVYPITNSTSNVNRPLYQQIEDLIENPFFAPDASCMFDAYQLHCIPGDHQICPKGFASNEAGTCFVTKKGEGCPDGYHSEDDDESGQCYPDKSPCYPGQIRYPTDRKDSEIEACGSTENVCEKYNMSLPESCFVEGIPVQDFPTAGCLTYPANDNCAVQNGTCPEGFATMNHPNFTSPKCVPESVEEVEKAEWERMVYDPNRCVEGYKLEVPESIDITQKGADNSIGYCNKIA